MHKLNLLIVLLLLSSGTFAQKKKVVPAKPFTKPALAGPKTFDDSLSYAIGISVGTFYKNMGAKNINAVFLSDAVNTVFQNKPAQITEQDINAIFSKAEGMFAEEKNKQQIKSLDSIIAIKFPQAKVVKNASGLRYEVLRAGTGRKPALTDTVVCHYAGTLADGKEFDNSYKRGEPVSFPVKGVIKGWTEALQLMPVGSKWRLFIPAQLGYGERGAGGGEIPPGAALIFDVELISIQ